MTTLETERLVLRPWHRSDVDALAAIFAVPAVWHFPFGRPLTREESERFVVRQLDHWDAHGFGLWAAELKPERRLIGFIGLSVPTWLPEVLPAVEVGWRLHPDDWGKGLATEGGRASLAHGFDTLGLDRIISIYAPENEASGRVMDKLGIRGDRTVTDPVSGGPVVVREITRAQWRRSPVERPDPYDDRQPPAS